MDFKIKWIKNGQLTRKCRTFLRKSIEISSEKYCSRLTYLSYYYVIYEKNVMLHLLPDECLIKFLAKILLIQRKRQLFGNKIHLRIFLSFVEFGIVTGSRSGLVSFQV